MLKRLELVGFKSFADKTRFDFAPGITAIVGPNGSGKSNVVDAVRWILGEQSAKSLRGGEMADVIFNGSSSRKSLGLAEVTVVFDNSRRLLALDADEVQLTRRVYRDGTGEYLINGQAARLKDFKEMFLGSGAGAGGYTIIAQGRVDELLQSSTKDRREIFDEAAGISRFKARKTETLRKLAVVEANVTRSQDRLDGLVNQLRTLRSQAAKAQKCQEYNDRLRELRIGLGQREYRELTATLEVEQQKLQELQAEVEGATARTKELERALRELDREVTRAEDGLRHQEGRLATAREQIAGFESTLKSERNVSTTLEAEILRYGRQRADLGYRIRAIDGDLLRAVAESTAAESRLNEEQDTANRAQADLKAAQAAIADIDRETETARGQQFERVKEAADARSRSSGLQENVKRLQNEYTRRRTEIERSIARRKTLAEALEGLSRADADLQARLHDARERIGRLRSDRDVLAVRSASVQKTLEDLRINQGDLRGKLEILEQLEQSLEGVGAGARFVLQQLKERRGNEQSPGAVDFTPVVGLVADLLTVPRDIAPYVELALGDAAQRFVVQPADAIDAIAAALGDLPGRVGLVPHGEPVPAVPESLAARIECDLPALPNQLLGNVLLADSLEAGRRLRDQHPGCRIVTRTGELLEPDGALTIGRLTVETGLVSRKSELRELREQHRRLAEQVAATEMDLAELRRRTDSADGVIAACDSEIALLSGEAGDVQGQIALQRLQVEDLDVRVELLHSESRLLEEEVQSCEAAWVAARLQAEEAEHSAEQLKVRLLELQHAHELAEQAREAAQQANTAAQVALSVAVSTSRTARDRVKQLEDELKKRRVEAMDLGHADRNARDRLADSTLTMLRASAGQADAYREKEHRERLVAELAAKAAADRKQREGVKEELAALNSAWKEKQDQAHDRKLAVNNLESRRIGIVERIREDYGIDLSAVPPAERQPEPETQEATEASEPAIPPEAERSHHEIQNEIEDLRRKLARLGSVNMEALEELKRVEAEYTALEAQHQDLNAARKALQDVIDAINGDSRKLFIETLTAIRGYFQELFRKLFGGGQADIILEDESDVLECGIEITARPPGKELRSLSLLSGGEKTLTAVALLLAIFRNKPSPFCILDEVDAALDEANTTRLASVLREFLDQSQFIVVTHKKRTMAVADRLWGVTMMESGVTRLLSMRFEDWPEEQAGESAA
jgi:chromosome segregation protein